MNRIYVAGPITKGDRTVNLRNAVDTAEALVVRGYYPFIPHLFDVWHLVHPTHDYEFWMTQTAEWLRCCNSLFRVPGESIGSDREIIMARDLGLPIYYHLNEVPWAMHSTGTPGVTPPPTRTR